MEIEKYILILVLLSACVCVTGTSRSTKGPFKSTALSVEECPKSDVIRPHTDYGSIILWTAEIYNASGVNFIKGNFTVTRPLENVKGRARSFLFQDNQWKPQLQKTGYDCKKPIVHLFVKFVEWPVDLKKCNVPKGIGSYNYFGTNAFQHAWEQEAEYGLWRWYFEVTAKGKTVFCFAVYSVVNRA